jgi:hypothetical protein
MRYALVNLKKMMEPQQKNAFGEVQIQDDYA